MKRKSLLKRGLLATVFIAAFAFATVGTSSEASARRCGGGGYYSGHHSGHYSGNYYGGGHRVHSSYYSPRTVYYDGGGHYGHGQRSHYYGGHGHHGYGAYYGGRGGVSVSVGF